MTLRNSPFGSMGCAARKRRASNTLECVRNRLRHSTDFWTGFFAHDPYDFLATVCDRTAASSNYFSTLAVRVKPVRRA